MVGSSLVKGLDKYSLEKMYQREADLRIYSDQQIRWVKILSYFVTYGFVGLIVGLAFLGRMLYKNDYGTVLGLSVGMLGMALYLLIGTIYRFRHIYCMHQMLNHEQMTPNDIYWKTLRQRDLYGIPALFLGIGLIALCIGLLGVMGIIG